MFENLFGMGSMSDLGILATITTIIVQLCKDYIPKKIPTKLVALITGIVVTVVFSFLTNGLDITTGVKGLFMGFIVSFISMNGFDSLREIWTRFQVEDDGGEEE